MPWQKWTHAWVYSDAGRKVAPVIGARPAPLYFSFWSDGSYLMTIGGLRVAAMAGSPIKDQRVRGTYVDTFRSQVEAVLSLSRERGEPRSVATVPDALAGDAAQLAPGQRAVATRIPQVGGCDNRWARHRPGPRYTPGVTGLDPGNDEARSATRPLDRQGIAAPRRLRGLP